MQPASQKLLYDESQNEGIGTWSVANSRDVDNRSRKRRSILPAIVIALLMFLVGITVGATLHAVLFPDGDSPLSIIASLTDSHGLINHKKHVNASEEVIDEDDESDERSLRVAIESGEKKGTADTADDDDDEVFCKKFIWNSRRLPETSQPIMYNLTIHPNVTSNKLVGIVNINLKIMSATKHIVLHADDLAMTSFKLSIDHEPTKAKFEDCKELDQWSFEVEKKLEPGTEASLYIEYEGLVANDLVGLYITTHTDKKDKKTRSAVTQFEPSYARRMFPCFDEPTYKAQFQLSVIRDPHHVVRSNMKLHKSHEQTDGLMKDVFEKSVKMSTYLLAVAILDDYDYVKRTTKKTKDPIEVRLYAPRPALKGQSEFGLDTAIRALEYFEDYFNISYPLDKMDLLAVDDFGEGAMENWGLVIFRDSVLLYSEGSTSAITKEQIALVICHEIAHQWFGNLVTMEWWNDLWLNEGFANYMEYRCVNNLFPDWNIMTRFYVDNVAFSHEPDGLTSSRAIAAPLGKNSKNIMSLFDAISYHKPAAIIHMIQSLAGEVNFQRALVEYLNKYAYENAKGSQLWAIMEKHAHLPDGISMQSLATAYTTQVGYPVVHVKMEKDEITISNQTRFLFKENQTDSVTQWPIPIYYRTDSKEEVKLQWLKPEQERVSWAQPSNTKWVIANSGGVAYLKVQYDTETYGELTKMLKDNYTAISAVDRVMLLVDAFDFSKTSDVAIDVYLNLLEYAEDEDDRMSWTLIGKQLKNIETLIDETDFKNIFQDFERTLVLKSYEKYAWDHKTNPGLELELIQLACRLRNRDCIKRAHNQYKNWIVNDVEPRVELQEVILEEGIRQGGVAAWERTLAAFKEANTPMERQALISALASSQDTALINRLLRLCIERKGPFRSNMIPRILAALSQNDVARSATWRFFRMHFDDFSRVFGEGSSLMTMALRSIVERLSTEHDLEELRTFLKDKKLHTSPAKINQVYEQIDLNIQWRALNEEALKKWLTKWDDKRRTLYRFRKHIYRH
ncbi:unnamed protein product [Auanema sp. JU1783]|nr:unnamed protein product [Auanema sp. JU1783]